MLFDVIIDNYDNVIPGSGQISLYAGKISIPLFSTCDLFTDTTWMVTCTTSMCPTCPDKCYLDALNFVPINEYRESTNRKLVIDMPWVNEKIKYTLGQYSFVPQRVLFDLPFIYYIK